MNYSDGLGKLSIGMIDIIKDDLKVNFIPYGKINDMHLQPKIKEIAYNPDKTAGNVSILTIPILKDPTVLCYQMMPESKIKIAYSVFESSRILPAWVEILNSKFDAVVVADHYLKGVYKDSGVEIPIFVIPAGMYLEDFLENHSQVRPHTPFIFGAAATFLPHKNLSLIIRAFAEEFRDSKDVCFRLHGKYGNIEPLQKLVNELGATNIIFSSDRLNHENYVDLINSIDCYINLSKGEGFSYCPREALALGIPCVLSNNTAQMTICDSGLVRSVPSNLEEPAFYGNSYYDSQPIGSQFNCHIEDVKIALRDVYSNYDDYLKLAQAGPEWVSQYSWNNLKPLYLNLFQPKKIILGDVNVVTDSYLMTNSPDLYKKYQEISRSCKNQHETDLNNQEIFQEIYQEGLWGKNSDNVGNSGPGSSMESTIIYRNFLQHFFKSNEIKSVVDFGCGDWEFSQSMNWSGMNYIGIDIVPSVIRWNQERFSASNVQFMCGDAMILEIAQGDLLLCKDVLQHLSNDDIALFLNKIKKFKHCLITNDVNPRTLTSDNPDIKSGRPSRSIDLTKPPFNIEGLKILTYFNGYKTKQILYIQN